jgi:hypothetical protein
MDLTLNVCRDCSDALRNVNWTKATATMANGI